MQVKETNKSRETTERT